MNDHTTANATGLSHADVRLKVKGYLHENPGSSTREIAESTGLDRIKVMAAIAIMVSQQRVNHVGETSIATSGYAIPTYSLAS